MMKSWEESVKFAFHCGDDDYFVNMPGIRDNEDINIEDGCYTIKR